MWENKNVSEIPTENGKICVVRWKHFTIILIIVHSGLWCLTDIAEVIYTLCMERAKIMIWLPLLIVTFSSQENFFCCAEKVVNGTGLEKLTRLLHQYNNITNEVKMN